MASKFFKPFQILKPKIADNLTSRRKDFESLMKISQSAKNNPLNQSLASKQSISKINKDAASKMAKAYDKAAYNRKAKDADYKSAKNRFAGAVGATGAILTGSGVSTVKKMKKEAAATKRDEAKTRVSRKFGNPNPFKRKTNVDKIKETFGPKPKKQLSPKQMKIAKLAGNKNQIDAADFAKLRRS
jgi:ribosomal protein L20A (L18A)